MYGTSNFVIDENGVLTKCKIPGAHSIPTSTIEVVIPNGVKKIGEGAFERCIGIGSVILPESVTEIGDNAFRQCHWLKTVKIPDSVTKIGAGAFGISGLTDIKIPGSVAEIGDRAFSMCHDLAAVTICDGVVKIGEGAFDTCVNLAKVSIPSSVAEIGACAFSSCEGLTSIVVHGSMGFGVFWLCKNLERATIYGRDDARIKIANGAFMSCHRLTNVVISDPAAEIGALAFLDCPNLASVSNPDRSTFV